MTSTAAQQHLPDITAFFAQEGRYPHLGDKTPPWNYRGWLLPYVINAPQYFPDIPDRWGYLCRTRAAGKLLDEPIPQIHFSTDRGPAYKQVLKWVELIERYDGSSWSSFQRLVEWLGWALGTSKYKPPLKEGADEKLYREVNIIPLLQRPSDYLGDIAGENYVGKNSGFYATPAEICEMMTRMIMGDSGEKDLRTASVCDPCVGTGRMLLAASNMSMNLYGQDINETVLSICRINGALYVPWMVAPLPAAILGKSIPEPPPAKLYETEEPAFRCDDKGQGMLF